MTNKGYRYSRIFLLVIGLVGLTVVTAAQEKDRETMGAALAHRAEGLIIAHCSVCHSADLIAQQRLPRARWEATIEKMKHWGAEISDDEADLLVRYLSARYHPCVPDQLPPLDSELRNAEPRSRELSVEGPFIGVDDREAGILEHNCQAGHGAMAVDGIRSKLMKNPILKDEDQFLETVLHGRGPMATWGSVLRPQDLADIHA